MALGEGFGLEEFTRGSGVRWGDVKEQGRRMDVKARR